jgi:hypothetical protein
MGFNPLDVGDIPSQVLALDAAVQDLKAQKQAGVAPDKLKTGRRFDRKQLVELYAPYIKGRPTPMCHMGSTWGGQGGIEA